MGGLPRRNEAPWAQAAVGALHVEAAATWAQALCLLAFIDIWRERRGVSWGKPEGAGSAGEGTGGWARGRDQARGWHRARQRPNVGDYSYC